MKKVLAISLLVVMLVVTFVPTISATTSATLADELYAKGAKYGMTAADKVRLERYLSENPITDEQANEVMAQADAAVSIMEEVGATSYEQLNAAQKAQVKACAVAAASTLDLTLVFKAKSVEIYNKAGELVEVIYNDNGKLRYTGNSLSTYLMVPGVAVIALAIAVVAKKKIADAE